MTTSISLIAPVVIFFIYDIQGHLEPARSILQERARRNWVCLGNFEGTIVKILGH